MQIHREPQRAVKRVSQDFSGESKTQQHFTEAADINNIVANYDATGIDIYASRKANQQFGDAPSKTYSEAMQEIAAAHTAWMDLPENLKQHWGDDPENFYKAIEDFDAQKLADFWANPDVTAEDIVEAATPSADPAPQDAADA